MGYYDKEVSVLIPADALDRRIRELGAEITRAYQGKELTLIGILKGAVFFTSELAKHIDLPVTLEFLGLTSYVGTETTGEVRITSDVTTPMAGKHLLVIEDIIDTGLTMKFLLENLQARHPASIAVAALLEKPSRARTKVGIDYKGFVIEDKFV